MKTNYKIYQADYTNEFGECKETYYFIKQRKTFLGIPYWSEVTHEVGGWDGLSSERTKFKTHREAYDFIHDVLEKKVGRSGWNEKMVNFI